MLWDRMTMDEYAAFERAEGLKVVKIEGIWWVEIRPFFYRPLFPFAEVDPHGTRYPVKTLFGGFLPATPAGMEGNSTINFFVYDNLKGYSLASVSSKRRKTILDGMKNFTARRITDKEEFIEKGHAVYQSFQKRTGYSYKDERLTHQGFRDWADNLYRNPKVSKLGAYHEGRLYAIEVSYLLEDVIMGDTLFANDEALKMNVTDFLYHTLRVAASKTDARYFFIGLPTGVTTLDHSKISRGCQILKMPAHYRMNPVTLSMVKVFMKSSYRKLQHIMAPPSEEILPMEVATATLAKKAAPDHGPTMHR